MDMMEVLITAELEPIPEKTSSTTTSRTWWLDNKLQCLPLIQKLNMLGSKRKGKKKKYPPMQRIPVLSPRMKFINVLRHPRYGKNFSLEVVKTSNSKTILNTQRNPNVTQTKEKTQISTFSAERKEREKLNSISGTYNTGQTFQYKGWNRESQVLKTSFQI